MDQTPRPRVFVSSVVEGFEAFRQTAREAIDAAGGEPVLVNEDFPAVAASSRNACLDAVDSCDIFLVMVGERGGWVAPSGKLVVEEEYERARNRGLPVLAFLQGVERDSSARHLADSISDYVSGTYRRTFQTNDDLRTEIERALQPALSLLQRPTVSDEQFSAVFTTPYQVPNETTLRFALPPERREEVIDPIQLGTREFVESMYRLSHSPSVGLFSYHQSKTDGIQGHTLVVLQSDTERSRDGTEETRLELTESGQLVIDTNVTGRDARPDAFDIAHIMVIAQDDIEAALRPAFAFAAELFDEIDQFARHQRFRYSVALTGIGYRTLVRTRKPQTSYSMGGPGNDEPVVVFDTPRLITRAGLRSPDSEIERVLTLLSRRLSHQTRY